MYGKKIQTPWGTAQSESPFIEGITFYSTAGHGGMKLSRFYNKKIPAIFRRPNGWYEEDCEYHIPMFFLYEDLLKTPLKVLQDHWRNTTNVEECLTYHKEIALDSLKHWFPVKFAVHFNQPELLQSLPDDQRVEALAQYAELLNPNKKETKWDKIEAGKTIQFASPQSYGGKEVNGGTIIKPRRGWAFIDEYGRPCKLLSMARLKAVGYKCYN